MAMWRMPHRYLFHKTSSPAQGRFDSLWSISYADLMTLLLCFFVVILVVSPPPVPRGDKAHSVLASLRSAFGATSGTHGSSAAQRGTLVERLVAMTEPDMNGRVDSPRAGILTLSHQPDGLHITLWGDAAVSSARSPDGRLTAAADEALRKLVDELRPLHPRIEVRAYAEANAASGNAQVAEPARQETAGLQDGFARAKLVVDVLAQCGLPIDRLQLLAAHGATPVGPGGGVSTRDACRVDLIVQAQGEQSRMAGPPSGALPGDR
jgi:hypothetical protein